MAIKDYANTRPKKATKGKNTRRKAPPPAPAPRRFLTLVGLVTFILLAAFGYGLWSISDSADTPPAPVTTQPVKPVKKQDKDALPPAPKEEWTYLQSLKDKKVEVDVSTAPKRAVRPSQIQCASFRSEAQALRMKATIAFQGLSAHVSKVSGSNGDWYKVVLGPYESKRHAERDRHVLRRGGINTCEIWQWEGK